MRDDDAAEAAGRDDGGRLAELILHALDHTVEHGGRTVDAAGAHGLDGVGTDALFRCVERDVRQLRRAACERLERDAHTGDDRAAEDTRLTVDDRHGGGRAHVDDNERRRVHRKRRGRTDHKVAAHGGGVVERDVQPRFHAGADDERADARDHAHGGDERAVDRRHDGRQDRPVDILRRDAGKLDHLPQRDRILVRGLITVGLQTGNVADARRIEKTDHNVCIANVQSQKHISPPDPSCRLRSAG